MAGTRIEIQRELRDDLVKTLSRELLGPFEGPDEALHQRPTGRYLLGRLAPAGTAVSPEEDEGAADGGADSEVPDTGYASPISMAMNPSSIGLSFTVDLTVDTVEVAAEWGTYTEVKRERRDGSIGEASAWVREQHTHTFAVTIGESSRRTVEEGVDIQWLCRMLPDGHRCAVSVFLVNRVHSKKPDRPDDSEWLFQPQLRARYRDGSAVFQSRSLDDVVDYESLDFDRRADELLFRDRPEYAVGHGCAADWEAEGGLGATQVSTTILPIHELARIDPRSSENPGLDMRRLGGTGVDGVPGDQLSEWLLPLADSYGDWIEGLENQIDSLDARLRQQARRHLEECRVVHRRIEEGIRLISSPGDEGSELARRAFCFANRAMALQRSRAEAALQRRRGDVAVDPDEIEAVWRPFQIAFILMNLPPLADRAHPDRETCDLLWFPTGGGKTEAYLGLTAFVLALRRIREPAPGYRTDGGVGVLMRYTLRLLTMQQFLRAATLACACEFLRASEGGWGDEPFSVGIWVGSKSTPNSYSAPNGFPSKGAKEALEDWAQGSRVKGGTPANRLLLSRR